MKNESPIGLATILGLAPVIVAGVIFVVLLILNDGDIEKATALTLGVIAAIATVGTAALRQWRAVVGVKAEAAKDVAAATAVVPPLPAPDEVAP